MITLHHLQDSRSHRILWLLEEIGAPYDVKLYDRTETREAPAALKAIHPLGKSPVVTIDGRTVHESGAIIEVLLRRFGAGKLTPAADTPEYDEYLQWLHYAEGSLVGPFIMRSVLGRSGEPPARVTSEIAKHLGYVEGALKGRDYLVAGVFTAADIQLSVVADLAGAMGQLEPYGEINAWLQRLQTRPAYHAAVAKAGGYAYFKGAAANA